MKRSGHRTVPRLYKAPPNLARSLTPDPAGCSPVQEACGSGDAVTARNGLAGNEDVSSIMPYETARASSAVSWSAARGACEAREAISPQICIYANPASARTSARGQYTAIVFFMMLFFRSGSRVQCSLCPSRIERGNREKPAVARYSVACNGTVQRRDWRQCHTPSRLARNLTPYKSIQSRRDRRS